MILPDRFPEALAPDEPHRVVGPPLGIPAHAVNRDDAGMLQHPGDLPLEGEPSLALGIVGPFLPDRLQRDLTSQFPIDGPVDSPQAPLGMGDEDLESGRRHRGRGTVSLRFRSRRGARSGRSRGRNRRRSPRRRLCPERRGSSTAPRAGPTGVAGDLVVVPLEEHVPFDGW